MAKTSSSTITFYSYKGGTGRTMALANTGYRLASEGRGEVLMIDWDLEAPGLHDFFPEVAEREKEKNVLAQGVLELFETAHDFAGTHDDLNYQDARNFWREADIRSRTRSTDGRSLHLLRAGLLDRTYGERVSEFPWQELFRLWPDLFRAMIDELATSYRYILIDSRTGLTDTGGICTSLLPDRLVAVFTPNRQSLDGLTDLVRRAIAYRGESSDLRSLLVFPLASRVETSEEALRGEWRYGNGKRTGYQPRFERLFEEIYQLPRCDLEGYFDEIQIQHAPSYAYGERVAIRDESSDRLSLSRSYERFTRALVEIEGPWTFGRPAPGGPMPDEGSTTRLTDELEKERRLHQHRARRARLIDIGFLTGAAVTLLTGSLIYLVLSAEERQPSAFGPWIFAFGVVAVVIFVLRQILAPYRQFAAHSRAANALTRELTLFHANAGVYAGRDYPLAVLAERLSEIEMEAEDALLTSTAHDISAHRKLGD
jgi:cellulose biosynthesis protein BcsQ